MYNLRVYMREGGKYENRAGSIMKRLQLLKECISSENTRVQKCTSFCDFLSSYSTDCANFNLICFNLVKSIILTMVIPVAVGVSLLLFPTLSVLF